MKTFIFILSLIFYFSTTILGQGSVNMVTDFGADPTGKLDNTTAFELALKSVLNNPQSKSIIYIPNGHYKFVRTFNIATTIPQGIGPSGWGQVKFVGENQDLTIIEGSFNGNLWVTSQIRASFERLTFSGIDSYKPNGLFLQVSDSTVSNCSFYHLSTALRLGHSAYCTKIDTIDIRYCGHQFPDWFVFQMDRDGNDMPNNSIITNLKINNLEGSGAKFDGQGVFISGLSIEISRSKNELQSAGIPANFLDSMIGAQFNAEGCSVNGAYIETGADYSQNAKLLLIINNNILITGSLIATDQIYVAQGFKATFISCKFNMDPTKASGWPQSQTFNTCNFNH